MLISSNVIQQSGIQFGTSGARGLVEQFTPEVCAAFTHAFLSSLESYSFETVAVAIDNRPSSPEIAKVCIAAVESLGLNAVYYGVIPTPALAYSAMQEGIPCIMVTGSHIPFDRNGLKFYTPIGEITKADELSIINAEVEFELDADLPKLDVSDSASKQYINRYTSLFSNKLIKGLRIGIYEHSSAGRDLYQGLFELLGAEVISLERTNEFVPIDTEAVADSDREKARTWSKEYNLDLIFSTDGDGDRPLVADENGEWLRGDILGLLCAQALNIDALAVPVSCNTIIADSPEFKEVVLTKIGSPYVIEAFEGLRNNHKSVAGFEANGGFLLGSDIQVNGKPLQALATRDAVLPTLMLLSLATENGVAQLVKSLPQRFNHSDRIQNFATEKSKAILTSAFGKESELLEVLLGESVDIRHIDTTDGLRVTLDNKDIIHLRPSGNAPELRCYAEACSTHMAQRIVDKVLSNIAKI